MANTKSNKMTGVNKITSLLCFLLIIAASACKNKEADGEGEQPKNDSLTVQKIDTALEINLDNPAAAEKILLVFQPEVGKTYYFTNNSSYSAYSKQDSFEMKAKSTKMAKIKMVVKELGKDNNYKIEFSLTDSRKTIKDDSSTLNYQYGKPMADPVQEVDRQIEDCLVNSPMILTMNKNGEAVNMAGYEDIIAKMKVILQTATGQQIPDQYIAQQMSLPTENIDNLFIIFPDTAVSIGQSWSFSTNSELQGMPILIESRYTVADRKEGYTYINLSSVVSVDKAKLPKEMVAEMTNLKVNSTMNGVIKIEEKTGWPTEMKISQFVEIKDSYKGVNTYSKETGSTTITLTN